MSGIIRRKGVKLTEVSGTALQACAHIDSTHTPPTPQPHSCSHKQSALARDRCANRQGDWLSRSGDPKLEPAWVWRTKCTTKSRNTILGITTTSPQLAARLLYIYTRNPRFMLSLMFYQPNAVETDENLLQCMRKQIAQAYNRRIVDHPRRTGRTKYLLP